MKPRAKCMTMDLGKCPKCVSREIKVFVFPSKTGHYFRKGDKVQCSKCEHSGEINSDGEVTWI